MGTTKSHSQDEEDLVKNGKVFTVKEKILNLDVESKLTLFVYVIAHEGGVVVGIKMNVYGQRSGVV